MLVCAPISATQGRYTCASVVGNPATEFRRNRTHPDIGRRWTSLSRDSVVPVPIFKYFALGRGQNRKHAVDSHLATLRARSGGKAFAKSLIATKIFYCIGHVLGKFRHRQEAPGRHTRRPTLSPTAESLVHEVVVR